MGKNQRYFYILALSVITFFAPLYSSCLAQNAETITISTYYPAPYGVHKILRLDPNDTFNPLANCSNEGEMYYDNSDNRLYACDGTKWQSSVGHWTLTGDVSLYPKDNAWNVGIGLNNPGYKLTVADTIHSAKALAPANGSETSATQTDSKFLFYDYTGSNWAGLGVDTGGDIWLRTGTGAPGAFSTITAGGTVGINTTSPNTNYKLYVNGKIRMHTFITVGTTFNGCGSPECTSYNSVPYTYEFGRKFDNPVVTCSSSANSNGSYPLLSCWVEKIENPTASSTKVYFRLSSHQSTFSYVPVSGTIGVYIIIAESEQ